MLPRILKKLKISEDGLGSGDTSMEQLAQKWVVVKNDRIFQHKLARFYHTTYDVRRSEDVINPRTTHCDVMLLADHPDMTITHPFLYGRVIGIYHVNVVYVGQGMKSYDAMRFDLLHVRWFQLEMSDLQDRHLSEWVSLRLNRLSFPSMASKDSFAFVDPSLVLRGCHLIPAFSSGKRHPGGTGFSGMAKDGNDWRSYYVNRSDTSQYFSLCLC